MRFKGVFSSQLNMLWSKTRCPYVKHTCRIGRRVRKQHSGSWEMLSLSSNPLQAITAGKRNNVTIREFGGERFTPGLMRVDSPDVNYALYFSKGAFLTDCNQCRLIHPQATSFVLHIDQRDLFDNELCCNSIIHPSRVNSNININSDPSIDQKKSWTWLDSCDSQIFPIEKDLFSTLGRNDFILQAKRLQTPGESTKAEQDIGRNDLLPCEPVSHASLKNDGPRDGNFDDLVNKRSYELSLLL